VLDRITGEFISGDKYVKRVTWAVGLDAKGRPIEAEGARLKDDPVLLSPGPGGAHNWQPMSFNPISGLVYIPGQESSGTYTPDPNFVFHYGFRNLGMAMGLNGPRRPDGQLTPGPGPATPAKPAKEPAGAENQPKASGGFLLAWDPVNRKERWRITNAGGFGGGGTLATAGNLVFHGSIAYNAETGEKLWDGNIGGLPVTPITYVLDGKQHVTLFGRAYPGNRVFTFVLDGKEPMPPLPETSQP
jgi:quinohemoprotein ethanol dehydrogenase